MRVLIVGGGNLGYYLAKNLCEAGQRVGLIDADAERCEYIAEELNIPVFCGDGTRIEVLSEAKAGTFDAVVAVTDKDEDNIIVCEIAKKQFGVGRAVSRSNNPKNISLMKKLGIDIAVNTTRIITDLIEHEIDGAPVQMIASISSSDAVLSTYSIPEGWSGSGKKIMELSVPENCVLVYIDRDRQIIIPRGTTELYGGDRLTALTIGNASKKLASLFEIK